MVSGWGVACVFAASRVRPPATIAFNINLLIQTTAALLDRRFRGVSQGKKTTLSALPNCFIWT